MVGDTGEDLPLFARPEGTRLPRPDAVGIGVSGGAFSGRVAVNAQQIDTLLESDPETGVVLIRPDTVPEEIAMIVRAQGLLTARGGATSHAAVTAKRLGKTAVVDCRDLEVDEGRDRALGGEDAERGRLAEHRRPHRSIFFGKREVAEPTTQAHRGQEGRGTTQVRFSCQQGGHLMSSRALGINALRPNRQVDPLVPP